MQQRQMLTALRVLVYLVCIRRVSYVCTKIFDGISPRYLFNKSPEGNCLCEQRLHQITTTLTWRKQHFLS